MKTQFIKDTKVPRARGSAESERPNGETLRCQGAQSLRVAKWGDAEESEGAEPEGGQVGRR